MAGDRVHGKVSGDVILFRSGTKAGARLPNHVLLAVSQGRGENIHLGRAGIDSNIFPESVPCGPIHFFSWRKAYD